jgi:DNA-binding NarL/FixJ family response regulator
MGSGEDLPPTADETGNKGNEEQEMKNIVRMHEDGYSIKEIADLYGLHPVTVRRYYMRSTENVGVRATVARVRRDRAKGAAWGRIAARYGTSKKVVKALYAEAA